MKFLNQNSEIFVPDGASVEQALKRTTHLGLSAHQDDLEIMAVDGILHCFKNDSDWFTGVILTDGRSSPRTGLYAEMSDEDMMKTRYTEQKKAAFIGNYSSQVLLGYTSGDVKTPNNSDLISDLVRLLKITSPRVVYTHNLADKHPTHIAVALRVIEAIRELPSESRPEKIFGCEVWRDLDWMPDNKKVVFDCSSRINLQESLLGVFDSQISGGKRYDLATMGRRLANATYSESHNVNIATHLALAMNLKPLIEDEDLDIADYVCDYIDEFEKTVRKTIEPLK